MKRFKYYLIAMSFLAGSMGLSSSGQAFMMVSQDLSQQVNCGAYASIVRGKIVSAQPQTGSNGWPNVVYTFQVDEVYYSPVEGAKHSVSVPKVGEEFTLTMFGRPGQSSFKGMGAMPKEGLEGIFFLTGENPNSGLAGFCGTPSQGILPVERDEGGQEVIKVTHRRLGLEKFKEKLAADPDKENPGYKRAAQALANLEAKQGKVPPGQMKNQQGAAAPASNLVSVPVSDIGAMLKALGNQQHADYAKKLGAEKAGGSK